MTTFFRSYPLFPILFTLLLATGCAGDDDEDLTGNWIQYGAFEGYPRSDAVAFVVDQYAYVGTGYNGNENERLKDFWKYDSEKDYWTQVASLPGVARNGAVAFSTATHGFVGTGYDGTNRLNDFYAYNPQTNSWNAIAPFAGSTRYGAIAFGIQNTGYVGTGYDGNVLKDFYSYNPQTDSWTQRVSVLGSKRRDATSFVLNGKGYVATGVDNGSYLRDFSCYNPEDDTWTALRPIADKSDDSYDDDYNIVGVNGVAFTLAGKAYIATGGPGYPDVKTWEYNPVTDLWSQKTNFEGSNRSEAVAFTIGSKGFVCTGRSSSYYFDDVWRFEPDAEYDDKD